MSKFIDSLSDLRYERGIVSFRIYNNIDPLSYEAISISFNDFAEIASLFYRELPEIASAHRNWVLQEADILRSLPSTKPVDSTASVEKLGRKIASL